MLRAPDHSLNNSSLNILPLLSGTINLPHKVFLTLFLNKFHSYSPKWPFKIFFRMLCIAVWPAYAFYWTVQSNWKCLTLQMTATMQSLLWRQGLFTCWSCAFVMRMTGGNLLPQGMTGSCLRPVEREEEEWLSADWLLGKPASFRGSKWMDRLAIGLMVRRMGLEILGVEKCSIWDEFSCENNMAGKKIRFKNQV